VLVFLGSIQIVFARKCNSSSLCSHSLCAAFSGAKSLPEKNKQTKKAGAKGRLISIVLS